MSGEYPCSSIILKSRYWQSHCRLASAPRPWLQASGATGIGTGLSSFGLDGELGFNTPGGGRIENIDLDNSETSDMLDSALGVNAFTRRRVASPAVLQYSSLEDNDSNLRAKWDRTNAELAAVYNFAKTGSSTWGVLAGLRYTDHEWDISSRNGDSYRRETR